MRLEGSLVIRAPRERVFTQLTDPAFVMQCAPGLVGVREIEPLKRYRLDVHIGLGPFAARFSTEIVITDRHPHERAVLRADGQSHLGAAVVTAELRAADDPGGTRVTWLAVAQLGGVLLLAVNPFVRALAHARIVEFFDCARAKIEAGAAPG